MKLLSKTSLALAALASLGAAAALPAGAASSNFQVFATGVDSTGAALPNGTLNDPHYTLVSNPAGTSNQLRVLTSAIGGNYPFPPYIGDSSASAWISPNNTPFIGTKPAGNYDYQTTFDLTGFNPATANITGNWAMDNYGTDILINGVSTGNTASGPNAYTPFSITSGFHAGVNTLDFLVLDDGQGATGLRVDNIQGTDTAPVPEASTTVSLGLLLALGLGGVLVARRKSAV